MTSAALSGVEPEQKSFLWPSDTPSMHRERLAVNPRVPSSVVEGTYRCSPPLVRPSKLTSKENGGIGKNLSEGWNLNFAVGCTHACPFCYVDSIHKRFGVSRYGKAVLQQWGDYLLIPENLDEAIEKTPWERWRGIEVMMSSTHDPYLPKLAGAARKILEAALPAGVRLCVQTRSYLVLKDLKLLTEYPEQVRLQVSIATANGNFARIIEPRVPAPDRRFDILRKAKDAGLNVGVILAPIFPPCDARPDFREDLETIAAELEGTAPGQIYGESFHVRGQNAALVERALGQPLNSNGFDSTAAFHFRRILRKHRLHGTWWPERS